LVVVTVTTALVDVEADLVLFGVIFVQKDGVSFSHILNIN
jgi:hypothetical protein